MTSKASKKLGLGFRDQSQDEQAMHTLAASYHKLGYGTQVRRIERDTLFGAEPVAQVWFELWVTMNVPAPENAVKLFDLYVKDAGNWNGQPLVGGNVGLLGAKEDRGLLTYLKRAGLVTTSVDSERRDLSWLSFTPAGIAFARLRGLGSEIGAALREGSHWLMDDTHAEALAMYATASAFIAAAAACSMEDLHAEAIEWDNKWKTARCSQVQPPSRLVVRAMGPRDLGYTLKISRCNTCTEFAAWVIEFHGASGNDWSEMRACDRCIHDLGTLITHRSSVAPMVAPRWPEPGLVAARVALDGVK